MSITKTSATLLLIIALIFSLFISCQKELRDDNHPALINVTPNVIINVAGRVTDETGKPVQGAQVIGLHASALTNINGEFLLKNASAYDKAAFVQIKKDGYFSGSRTFVASNGQTHYIEVELLNNTKSGSIDASTGGTLSLTSGASVTLAASSVVIKSTNAGYTGAVDVAIKWIDPTSEALLRQMPGDLRGINENNAEMGLQSYGMLAVELTSPSGEALQVAPGKMARLKFPLPASILASAPSTIPLWSFNYSTALWKYEGSATKVGNNYEAQVSHFSFWNCDAQFPLVDFTATVKDQNGDPLKNAMVKIKRTAPYSVSSAYTDTMGVVRGKVPQNEPLTLEVSMPNNVCNQIIHMQTVGPFSSTANISISVTLPAQQTATISGNVVDCNGAAVLNGSIELISGTKIYRSVVNNGSFVFSASVCTGSQTSSLIAIDSSTNQESAPLTVSLNPGANAVGTLSACGVSTLQFIDYTFNGVSYYMQLSTDSLSGIVTPGGPKIYGASKQALGSLYKEIRFSSSNCFAIGTCSLGALTVKEGSLTASSNGAPIPITMTEFGPAIGGNLVPGGYLAGNFSAIIVDSLAVSYPIQCTFRVRKQ